MSTEHVFPYFMLSVCGARAAFKESPGTQTCTANPGNIWHELFWTTRLCGFTACHLLGNPVTVFQSTMLEAFFSVLLKNEFRMW